MPPERDLFEEPVASDKPVSDHNPDPDVLRHHPAMPTRPDVLPKSSRQNTAGESKPKEVLEGPSQKFPELFDLESGHLIDGIIEQYRLYQIAEATKDKKAEQAFHDFSQEYLKEGRIAAVMLHFLKCEHCRNLRDSQ